MIDGTPCNRPLKCSPQPTGIWSRTSEGGEEEAFQAREQQQQQAKRWVLPRALEACQVSCYGCVGLEVLEEDRLTEEPIQSSGAQDMSSKSDSKQTSPNQTAKEIMPATLCPILPALKPCTRTDDPSKLEPPQAVQLAQMLARDSSKLLAFSFRLDLLNLQCTDSPFASSTPDFAGSHGDLTPAVPE
ncbi:hypothetical protein H920_09633 [Fukomys damarensis]|uniref:Uncharacterized protein n=1 Tax=Fukomys damarensis TaxID=885580 RepID=A0A091DEP8_FUKDA|nr:hypothetical protein H920_09633 [Fukomys damarensis]